MNAEKILFEIYDTYRMKQTERLPLLRLGEHSSSSIYNPVSSVLSNKHQLYTLKLLRINQYSFKTHFRILRCFVDQRN